jgi:hypothetical protein
MPDDRNLAHRDDLGPWQSLGFCVGLRITPEADRNFLGDIILERIFALGDLTPRAMSRLWQRATD